MTYYELIEELNSMTPKQKSKEATLNFFGDEYTIETALEKYSGDLMICADSEATSRLRKI